MARGDDGRTARVGDRPFHHVQLRCFAHATEDPAKVRRALAFSAGFDPDDAEDAKRFERLTTGTASEGHFRNPIVILETELVRSPDVRRFWDRILAVPGTAERLAREVEERLDDDLVLWVRLDKQQAYAGRTHLTAGEDVVQVRAKLATYPKDRTVALGFLRGFLVPRDAARPRPR